MVIVALIQHSQQSDFRWDMIDIIKGSLYHVIQDVLEVRRVSIGMLYSLHSLYRHPLQLAKKKKRVGIPINQLHKPSLPCKVLFQIWIYSRFPVQDSRQKQMLVNIYDKQKLLTEIWIQILACMHWPSVICYYWSDWYTHWPGLSHLNLRAATTYGTWGYLDNFSLCLTLRKRLMNRASPFFRLLELEMPLFLAMD